MDTNAQIKRAGTIKITDSETGVTILSVTYAAADIINALHDGESIESIIARCEGIEQTTLSSGEIAALNGNKPGHDNRFLPFGM